MATCVAVALTAGDALARESKRDVIPNRDQCWVVQYVPRLEQVNTKGVLVAPERRVWSGDVVAGKTVRQVQVPAVYYQTTKVLEEEHYTLVPTACAPRGRLAPTPGGN